MYSATPRKGIAISVFQQCILTVFSYYINNLKCSLKQKQEPWYARSLEDLASRLSCISLGSEVHCTKAQTEHVLHVTDFWVYFYKSFHTLDICLYLPSICFVCFMSQKWQELYMVEDWHIKWSSESSTLFTIVSPEEMLYKDSQSSCVLWNSSLNLLKKDCCSLSTFVIKPWLWCRPKAAVHFRNILLNIFWCLNLFTCDVKVMTF